MNRILGIVVSPRRTWSEIAREPTRAPVLIATLFGLCLLPAMAIAIGLNFFDSTWSVIHGYRPVGPPLTIAATNFVLALLTVLLLAAIFHGLAVPAGKPRKAFIAALNVAVYGTAPTLLAGALLVLPVMVVVMLLAGFHSLYLLSAGLQQVLDVNDNESAMLLAGCIVLLSIAGGLIGALGSAIGLI